MTLGDENTRAAALLAHDRVDDLLSHFQRPGATWDTFGPGQREAWLEQTKMDLVMLASCLEARIQELGRSNQDFGT
jgi:hypothetical protein